MRVQKEKKVLLIACLLYFAFISCRDASPQNIRIVMLGDSLTAWGDWQTLLNRKDIANKGKAGDTSGDVLERMEVIYRLKPQVAFVMIGINDILQDRSVENIFGNYQKIIAGLLTHNIRPVIQATLFLAGPDHRNGQVMALNQKLKSFAGVRKILFLDLNRVLAPSNQLLDSFTNDGLHLSDAGYQAWKNEMVRFISFEKLF
jgi:lysophospholipase L1-like esterase